MFSIMLTRVSSDKYTLSLYGHLEAQILFTMIGYIIEKLNKIFIQHAIGCYDDNDIV